MDLTHPLPNSILTCGVLLGSYLLFLGSLSITQRKIRRHRYLQRMTEYRKTGLDPNQVPESLRVLIPLAKKWEASSPEERRSLQRRATATDKLELSQGIVGHEDTILAWLKSCGGRSLTREAAAYESMLRSFHEMHFIVDDRYLPENETFQIDFPRQVPAPDHFPRASRFRPRFLRTLPAWTIFVIGTPVYIINFLIWGKLWSIFFPSNSSEAGLVIVGFVSTFMMLVALTILERLYELHQT